ncbi:MULTISPECIES: enoyl-CoA hydratase/isomerase family protein [unclassified Janibacter]|uniref:enoyl-CoA hydratase/isomerase family protein n=1 Tax=unclassified Janibacter TaxID=2649294 RepID=UPI003CFCF116
MTVHYAADARVGRITIDRPEARNALDLDHAKELRDQVKRALGDHRSDVVLLTGEGPTFSVGSDREASMRADDPTAYLLEIATVFEEVFSALADASKPIIAGIDGVVAGVGLGLVLSSDLSLASPSATFRVAAEDTVGTPDFGVSWLLPRAIGQQRALDLAMTQRTLDAETAENWGLVTALSEPDDFEGQLATFAARFIDAKAWGAGHTRRLLRSSWDSTRAQTSESEAVAMALPLLRGKY